MTKPEIAASLRQEVGHLEAEIKKLHARCDKLKQFVLNLEGEIAGSAAQPPEPPSKFRKIVDSIYGEKPKRTKR
jgi:hypothetical protein